MRVAVGAIAVLAPGLNGWEHSQGILCGTAPFLETELVLPAPQSLPPAERRRTTATIRLAMAAAEASLRNTGSLDLRHLASVFASANGDGVVIDAILRMLASTPHAVSPTQFHNSVHNGPPAYWSIGAHSNGASTSLGCWDASFAAALLQATAKASSRRAPVLLCAYDMPFPPPLAAVRATTQPFATAMVLTPRPEPFSVAELAIRFTTGRADARASLPRVTALHPLYHTNPAARALRLLETLARREKSVLELDYLDDSHLTVELRPC